jgi:2-phosphosulfolactate phosphatase
MKYMLFEVAFMPQDVKENSTSICVVIDVIRASTTMTHLLQKGCSEIILTTDEQQTMKENHSFLQDGTLICAEQVSGDAAEGADFSPSLMAIEKENVENRRVVMRTTNGTVAVHTLLDRGVKHIFVGCMNNARAVMKEAVTLAKQLNTGVMIVSSGRENTKIAALDDTYCAAKLLDYGKQIALANGITPFVADSGIIASHLLLGYKDAEDAFTQSASGAVMRSIQCEQDIFICAQENKTDTVGIISFENAKIHVKKVKSLVNN